jgi:hypothetical protein
MPDEKTGSQEDSGDGESPKITQAVIDFSWPFHQQFWSILRLTVQLSFQERNHDVKHGG